MRYDSHRRHAQQDTSNAGNVLHADPPSATRASFPACLILFRHDVMPARNIKAVWFHITQLRILVVLKNITLEVQMI